MLAFNKEVTSERTPEQLVKLQESVLSVIKEIAKAEKEDNFPRKHTALCDYCLYKEYCPSCKHFVELSKKSVEQFKKDDGVRLVDNYAEIKAKLTELEKQKEEFENKLIEFSKQLGVDVVYGRNMLAKVKEYEKIVLPEEKEELIAIMKEKGIWDEVAMINFMRLQSKYFKGELHPKIHEKIQKEKDWRIILSKRKDVGEE